MVGFAISIVSFFIVAGFLIFLGMGALALIGAMFSSSGSGDSKAKGLLHPVLKILGIGEGETMHPNTPEAELKEAIKVYYEILKKVFDSETPEQRKELLSSNSPSGRVSNAFYAITGLSKAINILTKDISYVMDGSGWTEYKRLLKDSTNGTLKKVGDKYEIIFNKDFYLTIAEHHGYGSSYDDEKEWRIEGHYNKKEVLSCYAPRNNDTAYTFKPDVWILDVLQSAEKYAQLINEHKLNEATKRRESELFG